MTFEHQRHKPPSQLERPRELIIAMPPMRSHVNLSRIVRAAGCCGVRRVIACGNAKLDLKIARDGADQVEIEIRRTLMPVLDRLRQEGYQLVGLEQATGSVSLYEFSFPRRMALIIGHERNGIDYQTLARLNHVVEIPVYGLPHSHNAATAAAIAMYEYCRQFPIG
ncbi:MAG: hypothetical protein KDA60_10070 [Planctomycetales bacterium]|nr:hypothetical protein [Planctomycetales bacterium]